MTKNVSIYNFRNLISTKNCSQHYVNAKVLSSIISDLQIDSGKAERLKTNQKLVAPSAISDKRVVRMKLTDPCVLGAGRCRRQNRIFARWMQRLSEGSMTGEEGSTVLTLILKIME